MYSLQMFFGLRRTEAYSSSDGRRVEGFFGGVFFFSFFLIFFFFGCGGGGGGALKQTCTVGVWGEEQRGGLVVS